MKSFLITFIIVFVADFTFAQIDTTLLKKTSRDTSKSLLNMDAVYNRPFMAVSRLPVSLGGYMEVNWQHLATDGISEGHQFQARRMTLFVASEINSRLKFLSELEIEEGGRELAVEFAAIDLEFTALFNLRSGIILNPIGAFNQNHDGPKWEFTDRPIMATQLLPATFSNAGFGAFGKLYRGRWMLGYEAYVSGGFDNSIIDNTEGKTFLPAAKNNASRFEAIASGIPLFTGKLAVRYNKAIELGLSYMGQTYNKFMDDGFIVDIRRRMDVAALDVNVTLPKINTFITAEMTRVMVEVPETYGPQFGQVQQGAFVDVVQPFSLPSFWGWDKPIINAACRFEHVDWNRNTFQSTSTNIADDLWSIMPGVSFRPSAQTVIRLNYRYLQQRDLVGNPPAITGGFSLGFSTYF